MILMAGRCYWLVIILILPYAQGDEKSVSKDMKDLKRSMEIDLVKSVYHRLNNGIGRLNVDTAPLWNQTIQVNRNAAGNDDNDDAGIAEPGGLFRYQNRTIVLTGRHAYEIRRNGIQTNHHYELQDKVLLLQKTEWKGVLLAVICFTRANCRVLATGNWPEVTFHQTIDTKTQPQDVVFFTDKNDLYLIIVKDPTIIYRWTGTYFDEAHELQTSGAKSAVAFSYEASTVIVIAQNLHHDKVFSKAYVKKGNEIVLIHLIPSEGPSSVTHFKVLDQNFVIILNEVVPSKIYWWRRELVFWMPFSDVTGPHRIGVSYINNNTFLLVSRKNKLLVYHATGNHVELSKTFLLDEDKEVISAEVYHDESTSDPILMVLSRAGSFELGISFTAFRMNRLPLAENQKQILDPVLQCMNQLEDRLNEHQLKLSKWENKIKNETNLPNIEQIRTKKLILDKSKVKNLKISSNLLLKETPEKIKTKLETYLQQIQDINRKITTGKKYIVKGDLMVDNLYINDISVNEINKQQWNVKNWLSKTGNQTLRGNWMVKDLKTEKIEVGSINGISTHNILMRKKPKQYLLGEHHVKSLTAKDIKIVKNAKINGIILADVVSNKNFMNVITGRKTFSRLIADNLHPNTVNNVPFETWTQNLPMFRNTSYLKSLDFDNLSVKNITVAQLNNIDMNTLISILYGDTILTYPGETVKIKNLIAKEINGIKLTDLFTIRTNQTISGDFDISNVIAQYVDSDVINGLETAKIIPYASRTGRILTFNETTTISGHINATKIIFKNPFKISGRIVNLDEIKNEYWMKNLDQIIPTKVDFLKNISVNKLTAEAINNRSVVDNFININAANDLNVNLNFQRVNITGNVHFDCPNENRFHLKSLIQNAFKRTGENFIRGPLEFKGKLYVDNLNTDYINKININNIPTKEDVHIQCPKSLKTLSVNGSLISPNGIKVSNVNKQPFKHVISTMVMLSDNDILEHGNFSSLKINNIVAEIVNDVDTKDNNLNKNFETFNLIVEGDLIIPSINVSVLNNIQFHHRISKVVQNNQAIRIHGEKDFKKTVEISKLEGSVNGLSMRELYLNGLSKTKNQNITGVYSVDHFITENIQATTLDNVDVEDLLYTDIATTQKINSNLDITDFGVNENLETTDFQCDLEKVASLSYENIQNFNEIEVQGDVVWAVNQTQHEGLSYIFDKTVPLSTTSNIEITGKTTLTQNTTVNFLSVNKKLNNIDLIFIIKDAVYESQANQSVRNLRFREPITADNAVVKGNLITDKVNGVRMLDLNRTIVRIGDSSKVEGKKSFVHGFTVNHLYTDQINDASIEAVVFWDEMENCRKVKNLSTIFENIAVLNNLTTNEINGIDLEQLFQQRVSKTVDQTINGNIVFGSNLTIKEKSGLSTPMINDIRIPDIVVNTQETNQTIEGNIEFRESISILDRLEVKTLNTYDIRQERNNSYMTDEDLVINNNIVFEGDIENDGNIDVVETVNSCDLKEIQKLQTSYQPIYKEAVISKQVKSETSKARNLSSRISDMNVFMYFEKGYDLTFNMSRINKISVNAYKKKQYIDVYGLKYGECGLPKECFCPAVTVIEMFSLKKMNTSSSYSRIYRYFDEDLDVQVYVFTNTISYSSTCQTTENHKFEEFSTISWKTENGQTQEVKLNNGFLSDAKFFKLGTSVYAVLAFSYNSTKAQTRSLSTFIYEINTNSDTITKTQELFTRGAYTINVVWTYNGVILITASLFETRIFRFIDTKNKFELLQIMKSFGVLSIHSLRNEQHSFVFLVQRSPLPLQIYKYNSERDRYAFYQQIYPVNSTFKTGIRNAAVVDLNGKNYSGDILLAVVMMDGRVTFYKYRTIEGFVELYSHNEDDVQAMQHFRVDKTFYILMASTSPKSKIVKIVTQNSHQ